MPGKKSEIELRKKRPEHKELGRTPASKELECLPESPWYKWYRILDPVHNAKVFGRLKIFLWPHLSF